MSKVSKRRRFANMAKRARQFKAELRACWESAEISPEVWRNMPAKISGFMSAGRSG